jgi:hypothetical protein
MVTAISPMIYIPLINLSRNTVYLLASFHLVDGKSQTANAGKVIKHRQGQLRKSIDASLDILCRHYWRLDPDVMRLVLPL